MVVDAVFLFLSLVVGLVTRVASVALSLSSLVGSALLLLTFMLLAWLVGRVAAVAFFVVLLASPSLVPFHLPRQPFAGSVVPLVFVAFRLPRQPFPIAVQGGGMNDPCASDVIELRAVRAIDEVKLMTERF